jgi:4-amino-4-deoxy-L-arabinose transferase-like glycosyltransferase
LTPGNYHRSALVTRDVLRAGKTSTDSHVPACFEALMFGYRKGRSATTDKNGMSLRVDRHLVLLTMVAFVGRATWLLRPAVDIGDSPEYLRLASWLVARHMFSDDGQVASSYRPPLYPAVIAAGDLLTDHPIAAVLFLQVLLGTLTVVLTYRLADELFGRTTAAISGFLLALAPMTSRFSALMLTETLFTFLVVLAIWAWVRSKTGLSGIAFGLATLTRASSLPYLLALTAYGLLGPRGASRKAATAVGLAALLTVAPWVLRNFIEVGRLTVADAGSGVNLFYGTIDLRRGDNRWSQLIAAHARMVEGAPSPSLSPQTAGSNVAEARARDFAMSWIRQNPVVWLGIRARQWPWLFIDTGDYLPVAANKWSFGEALAKGYVATVVLKMSFLAGNALLLMLAASGLWSLRGRLQAMIPLWTFPIYLAAAHVPVYVEPRYGLPLVPFLAILGGEGMRIWTLKMCGPSSISRANEGEVL